MYKKILQIAALLALGLLIIFMIISINWEGLRSADLQTHSQNEAPPKIGGPMIPNVELKTYDGRVVQLHDHIGKPLVINSWAAWCPFCRQELPDFAAVQKKFKDTIEVIAINRAESLSTAKRYTDDLDATNLTLLLDSGDNFYNQLGGFAMPETIFVDSEGIIMKHKRGVMNEEEITQHVIQLLNTTK